MRKKLLTVREVSQILKLSEQDVIELAEKGQIPHFKIGNEFLRFKPDDIERLRDSIRRRYGVYVEKVSWSERIKDFFYFNDFYIISGAIIFILLYIIIR